MLANIVDNLRTSRAEFARDVEYLKESISEETVDTALESAESQYFSETAEELREAAEWADRIKIESVEDTMNDEAEVKRILESDHDLSFDEMVNLDELKVM